jgi:hypothetical protein
MIFFQKLGCAAIATFWLLGSSASFAAIDHLYSDSRQQNFGSVVIAWLMTRHADPASVSGGFSGPHDFHVFARPGNFQGSYRIRPTRIAGGDIAPVISQLDQNAKIIGISDNDFWILSWSDK